MGTDLPAAVETTYIAPRRHRPLDGVRELLAARELFQILFRREIRLRYAQTVLGVVWVVLQPVVPALIFATVLGSLGRLPSDGVPYFLFALTGLVAYGLVSGAVSRAGGSFLSDARLLTKVYFPRAVLPIASGASTVVDFLIGLALVALVMLVIGVAPTAAVLALPVIIVLILVLALSVGLAAAALGAYYRDFAYALPFVLQVWLYASPVLYSVDLVPAGIRVAYGLNPLVGLIGAARWALVGSPAPPSSDLVLGFLSGLAIVVTCWWVFGRIQQTLADVI